MAKIELPLAANVLFTDPAGKLQGQTLRTNVLLETALAPQADCRVTEITPGELFCAAGADGVTLRCPVQVTLASTARHALKAVCGGTTEPEPEDARAARRHPAAHGAAGAGLGYRKGLPHCAGDGHGGK